MSLFFQSQINFSKWPNIDSLYSYIAFEGMEPCDGVDETKG